MYNVTDFAYLAVQCQLPWQQILYEYKECDEDLPLFCTEFNYGKVSRLQSYPASLKRQTLPESLGRREPQVPSADQRGREGPRSSAVEHSRDVACLY